jgi:hypothetical protein
MLRVQIDRRLIRRIVDADDAIVDLDSFVLGASSESQRLNLPASLAFQLLRYSKEEAITHVEGIHC